MSMTPDARPTPPTLEQIAAAINDCICRVGQSTGELMLMRIHDLLKSGDYAILSRADRSTAIARAMKAMHLKDVGLTADAEQARSEAYQLLQLQDPAIGKPCPFARVEPS